MKVAVAIFSTGLFCLFVVGATSNARCWIKGAKSETRSSVAPLVAGIVGCLALLLCPFYQTARYAWLPLFFDVGCLPYLIGVSIYLFHDWWITSPRFKTQAFKYTSLDVHLTVTLFRTGQVRMLKTNLAPRPAFGVKPHWLLLGNGGTWIKDDCALILETHQGKIIYQEAEADKYVWRSSDRPTAFDHLDLEKV